MIYSRIVIFVNAPEASVTTPTRARKMFVIGDVISFLIQAFGRAMTAQAVHADLGKKVVLTRFFCQLLFFGFFFTITIIFDRWMAKCSLQYSIPKYGKHGWRALLILLLVSAFIIIERCVYRICDFSRGPKGILMGHEVWMYVGDTALIFVVQAMFLFMGKRLKYHHYPAYLPYNLDDLAVAPRVAVCSPSPLPS